MLSSVTPAFVAGRESETLIPRPSKLRTVLRLDFSVAETMEMGYADVMETMSTETPCLIGPVPIRQKMS
jgi:hypothetical protein